MKLFFLFTGKAQSTKRTSYQMNVLSLYTVFSEKYTPLAVWLAMVHIFAGKIPSKMWWFN
ncbi:MAG: hypothetical protein ACFFCD_17045 [Promethearchaeota archaeon]